MAVGLDITDRVCIRHPQQPAVARCASCMKPVCKACIVQQEGHYYCSTKCADAVTAVAKQAAEAAATQQARRRKATIRLVTIIATAVVVVAVSAFLWQKHRHKLAQAAKEAEAMKEHMETELGHAIGD